MPIHGAPSVLASGQLVVAQFEKNGAAAAHRGQWLCYGPAFEAEEGRVSLTEALGQAVDESVLQGVPPCC